MDKTQTKAQARKARLDAVLVNHRDMSTEEITTRIAHHQTLIGLYENQRSRNQALISDASNDIKTCDRMLDELRGDVTALNTIIKSRRC